MKRALSYLYLSAFILLSSSLSAQEKSGYEIVNRIHLDGDGGWDYLTMDEDAGLLYVSHGTMVQVVDVKTDKLIATIEDTKGVHGITRAAEFGKGYISCGRDSTVVVFDIRTFKTLSRVKVNGANPDAILYDPFSKNVFVFNGRSKNVTVIDAKTDKIVSDIPLEGKPEFAVTDYKGKVYVNIEDKSKLCMINSKTLKVEQYWPVAPVEEPSGLAIDTAHHRLFTVCDKLLGVIDIKAGKVIESRIIGDRVDGVAYDNGLKRIYSANGDGTMSVLAYVKCDSLTDPKGFRTAENCFLNIETVKTQKGARTIAVDSKTHHIYLPTAEFGAAEPGKRPATKSGSFVVLDIAPVKQ